MDNKSTETTDTQDRVNALSRVLFNNLALQFAAMGMSEPDIFTALLEVATRLGARVCSGNGHLSGAAAAANVQAFYLSLIQQVDQVQPPQAPPTPKYSRHLM